MKVEENLETERDRGEIVLGIPLMEERGVAHIAHNLRMRRGGARQERVGVYIEGVPAWVTCSVDGR